MVGDGSERTNCIHRARCLGVADQCVFVGKQARIVDYLCASDILLLPSEQESFGLAALGKLGMGLLADRLGARRALVLNLLLTACGIVCLASAASAPVAVGFVVVYGLTVGAPLTLAPMLVAESLGLRRFGSLAGLAGIFNVAGAASGPLVAGRLFDASGSYAGGFALFVLALLVGSAATYGCLPLPADAPSTPSPPPRRPR